MKQPRRNHKLQGNTTNDTGSKKVLAVDIFLDYPTISLFLVIQVWQIRNSLEFLHRVGSRFRLRWFAGLRVLAQHFLGLADKYIARL